MSRRAIISTDDLRRWARVSREEGVTISGQIGAEGVTILVNPAIAIIDQPGDDDFDQKMRQFLGK